VRSAAYRRLESIWSRGGVVVLDGGVGSELQRVGFPRDRNVGELWGTIALLEAPELAKEVHSRYARAGADVITTHTWRIDGLPAAESAGLVSGSEGGWRNTARRAVEIARDAATELHRPETAVAFSVWPEPLEPAFTQELAEAIVEAGPDLILAETAETIPPGLLFPVFELLLETGLPLWVSYRWTVDGPPDLRHQGIPPYAVRLQEADGGLLVQAAAALEELGVSAVLLNCLPRELIPGMLPLLRTSTKLPLGVYPNVGSYRDPGWSFDDEVTPATYAADARRWRDIEGAQIVGGCCGTTPEHIAAVVESLGSR
jgi:S-methylmethionine-dependent homocysteine/selenocysteine methylase